MSALIVRQFNFKRELVRTRKKVQTTNALSNCVSPSEVNHTTHLTSGVFIKCAYLPASLSLRNYSQVDQSFVYNGTLEINISPDCNLGHLILRLI